jgi:hypothetical protein
VICEILKTGPTEQIQQAIPLILRIQDNVATNSVYSSNSLVRKFRVKLISRLALRLLPAKSRLRRKGWRQHLLVAITDSRSARALSMQQETDSLAEPNDETAVPEEVESILDDLFQSLQDRVSFVLLSFA